MPFFSSERVTFENKPIPYVDGCVKTASIFERYCYIIKYIDRMYRNPEIAMMRTKMHNICFSITVHNPYSNGIIFSNSF